MPSPPMPPMSVQPQLSKESLFVGTDRSEAIDLRSRIASRIGADRAKRYFALLALFLGVRISKSEFDKLCCAALGRENLPLHNQLVSLLLKNACRGIRPPPSAEGRFSAFVEKNGFRRDLGSDNTSADLVGSKRKLHYADSISRERLAKRFQVDFDHDASTSTSGRDNAAQHLWSPLYAPFGIPLLQNRHSSFSNRSSMVSSYECGELCDTKTLKERTDGLLAAQGFGTATVECAQVLNIGVDALLKRLIKSCIELAKARSRPDGSHSISIMLKKQLRGRQINGVALQNRILMLTDNKEAGEDDGSSECKTITLQDFNVALDLNRQINGPNYASVVSKLSLLDR